MLFDNEQFSPTYIYIQNEHSCNYTQNATTLCLHMTKVVP